MATDDYTLKDRIRDLGDSIADQFKNLARQLEIIEGKLDGKASLGQLSELEDRVTKSLDRLDGRVTELERQNWGSAAISRYQKFLLTLACCGGVVAVIELVRLAAGGH